MRHKENRDPFYLQPQNPKITFPSELVILLTNWSPPRGDSCLSSKPVTKTSNENQSKDSLSASTLRTRRKTYPKERTTEVTRPKKAAKESNKPKGSQVEEESLREHTRRELLNPSENLTMSTSMATGVLGMPVPESRHAPEFNSRNPEELKEFLEEFEELAERHGLMTKKKTKIVVKYIDKETKKFWKRLKGYGDDYVMLKRKIIGAYSKTLLEDKLTVAKLVKLVKKLAKESIKDEEDLDTYYRKFWIVAADLVETDVINKKQHDEYFWKGLPRELRYAISDRLEA